MNDNPTEKVIYLDDLGWRIIKGLIVARLNWTTRQTELLNSLNGGNITFTTRSVKEDITRVIPQNSTIKIKTVVKTEGTGSGHIVTKVF